MLLVELTQQITGDPVHVNPEAIKWIEPLNGGSLLVFGLPNEYDNAIAVTETVPDIQKAIVVAETDAIIARCA